MKKQLLSVAAFLFAGSLFAQENVDVTPTKYKFANQPVGKLEISKFYTGANISAPCDALIEELYNDGLLVVAGGQFANTAQPYATDLQNGVSIVDLGGEVGKVMCVNGVNSNYNTLYGMDYAKCTGGLNWFNFNWFMDPQNTPVDGSAENPNIRVRVVMNIYANTLNEGDVLVDKAYMVTNQGNVLPENSNTDEGVAVATGAFAELDEDGEPVVDEEENYVYDPTKWMVYEWDTYCPNDPETPGAPLRLKMEIKAGPLAAATLFIKEISFTKLAENAEPIIGKRKKSFVKYAVDPQSVSTAIETVKSTEGKAEYYTLSGLKVNADNLTQGVYIVKDGAATSKVVVK